MEDDGTAATVTARATVPGIEQSWTATLPSGPVELMLSAEPPTGDVFEIGMTSDLVHFTASADGTTVELAAVDGRYLSAETAASFTGRVIGLFAVRGAVTFDGYRYTGSER